jgi:hypothetical protein
MVAGVPAAASEVFSAEESEAELQDRNMITEINMQEKIRIMMWI